MTNAGLTFENFNIAQDEVHAIGWQREREQGVLGDIAVAFDGSEHELSELLTKVAPHRDLQENIAFAHETLSNPEVQKALGYEPGTNPHQIGHDWAKRSGLQAAVYRPFMEPHTGEKPQDFDAAIIPDRVVRWMTRMGDVAMKTSKEAGVGELIVVATARKIDKEESEHHANWTRHQFAATELVPRMSLVGNFSVVSLAAAQRAGATGEDVMNEATDLIDSRYDIANPDVKVLLPTVAGNWMQTGAQARKAFQEYAVSFDDQPGERQLWVRCEEFATDPTGEQPPTKAQNSLSAIGSFLRGVKLIEEFQR